MEKYFILTAINKHFKFPFTRPIDSRPIENILSPLREILFYFCVPEFVFIGNEKQLNSEGISYMMEDELGISLFQTNTYRSEINGLITHYPKS